MYSDLLTTLYQSHKESSLFGRYITPKMIAPLFESIGQEYDVSVIGYSVNQQPIHAIKLGTGEKRVLLWSQMHGNESTTTKALFDLLNAIISKEAVFEDILKACTLCIIPMLNPDGAALYTRLNANGVDLNRDAQDLSQPESAVLRQCFDKFLPDYCFNLHGQRTIYGVGNTGKSAILSFLSPAQDKQRLVTETRKIAMSIIAQINMQLQSDIPDSVGRYDDEFNINCVGDTFQSLGTPTVLYEAGHYKNDYNREITRFLVFKSLYYGLDAVVRDSDRNHHHRTYFNIPENQKNFYDIIVKNTIVDENSGKVEDVAIQYTEKLDDDSINFIPEVVAIGNLSEFYAHNYIDAKGKTIFAEDNTQMQIGYANVFVLINNEKITLKAP